MTSELDDWWGTPGHERQRLLMRVQDLEGLLVICRIRCERAEKRLADVRKLETRVRQLEAALGIQKDTPR